MCSNPIKLKKPDGSTMMVGCGHCLQCLKAYQDSWTARLNEELKSWCHVSQDGKMLKPVIFFTLDYRPEAIPCRYLVVTDCGVRIQDERPDCHIEEFWTDTRRETHEQWLVRRKYMLTLYHRYAKLVWSLQDRKATREDIFEGNYRFDGGIIHARYVFDCDIPTDVDFFTYKNGTLEHPVIDYDILKDTSNFGSHNSTPLIAFEFHSVSKPDVQKWNKRGRIRLTRLYPDIFDQDVNPRFIQNWSDASGNSRMLPSCALPKNVKFFITSEYGPLTHRPHYHGVMFGLTYDEFEECFAKDWESNFGHCDFSVLRDSGGAITYLSKYCSKGSYEHPYCCKDMIYPSGEEYHSKDYFNCIEDFGVNWPMVRPTFHLVSKGMGANYAFGAEVQQYFGASLSEFLTDTGKLKYIAHDGSLIAGVRPSIDLTQLIVHEDGKPFYKSISIETTDSGDITVNKLDSNGRLVGQSVITASAVVNTAIEYTLSKTIYSRSYVKQNFYGKSVPGRCLPCWHKIGLLRLCNPETVTTTLSLPRYYRQWLVSPLASLLRQAVAKRERPSWDEIKSGLIRQGRPADEVSLLVGKLMDSEAIRNQVTALRLRKSAESFFFANGFKNLD